MNHPELYVKVNHLQRHDAKNILDEFSKIIKWRIDQQDTLLDVGCGPGDVTMDYILPMMPKTFKKLIGIDKSRKMILYANETYENARISFKTIDITADFDEIWKNLQQKFDHIFSFYCLHWIQDLHKTAKNMYNILEENGDCLLVFLASHVIFDGYKELSSMNKWQPYMKDVDKVVGFYQNEKDAHVHFQNILYSAGFTDCSVDLRSKIFLYENQELFRNHIRAINPFSDNMTCKTHEEFLNEHTESVANSNKRNAQLKVDDCGFVAPYKLLVAYAKK